MPGGVTLTRPHHVAGDALTFVNMDRLRWLGISVSASTVGIGLAISMRTYSEQRFKIDDGSPQLQRAGCRLPAARP